MDKVPFLIAFPGKRIERNQLGIFCLAPDADIEGGHGRFIIWEILTVVVVAGLLVTIMANATPILDLSPASGREGDTVTVTGSSFDVVGVEFAQATIKFNGNVVKSNVLLNGNGFTTSFIIPSNTPPGTYTVQAIGPKDSAEATFTVMEMQVEPFPLWPMIGLFGIAAGAIVIRHHTRSPAIKAPLKQKFPKPPVHIDIQSGVECSSGVDCEDTKLTDISVDIRSGIWKEGGER